MGSRVFISPPLRRLAARAAGVIGAGGVIKKRNVSKRKKHTHSLASTGGGVAYLNYIVERLLKR